jgi:hypothetical protein
MQAPILSRIAVRILLHGRGLSSIAPANIATMLATVRHAKAYCGSILKPQAKKRRSRFAPGPF